MLDRLFGQNRGGPSVAVRGQEFGQRREQLVGSLLGEPVADAGNDKGLYVVRPWFFLLLPVVTIQSDAWFDKR